MDERRKKFVDARIRRRYINKTERKIFKKVSLFCSLLGALSFILFDLKEGVETSIFNLILNGIMNGVIVGILIAMITSATHNLFRQQIARNFTGTDEYNEFKENELKSMYENGLIEEEEYFESLES